MVDFNPAFGSSGITPPGVGSGGGIGSTGGTGTVDMPNGPTVLASGSQLSITVEPNSLTDPNPLADDLAGLLIEPAYA